MRFLSIGECMVEFARSRDGDLWSRNFAGDTFNTAWYFNKLSPADFATDYFTCVGDDKASDELLKFIDGSGIGTGNICQVPDRAPGLYSIDLDGAERSFSYWRDNSAAKELASDPKRLAKALESADEIYFSGITMAILSPENRTTLVQALGHARAAGKMVSFDPNIRPRLWNGNEEIRRWTHEAASVSSRVFPTHDDEAGIFGDKSSSDTADRYHALGVEEVVVKNGPDACLATNADLRCEVAAQFVENPVDTTGAGDSFNAGYLIARTQGASLELACSCAHALSANVIQHHGALVPEDALAMVSVAMEGKLR